MVNPEGNRHSWLDFAFQPLNVLPSSFCECCSLLFILSLLDSLLIGCPLTTSTPKWYVSGLVDALRWKGHLKFAACCQHLLSFSCFVNPKPSAYLLMIIPTSWVISCENGSICHEDAFVQGLHSPNLLNVAIVAAIPTASNPWCSR